MFAFRLRFYAPPGSTLEPANLRLELEGAPSPLVVRQPSAIPDALPTDVVVITIDGDGFASAEAASLFGSKLKSTLAVLSCRRRLGFNLGDDRSASSLGESVRDQIRQDHGLDVRPTVHGLDVFDATGPVARLESSGARLSQVRVIRGLDKDLVLHFKDYDLSPKLRLALSLYNGCAYENDSKVRFLSLVTVIEALATRPSRGAAAREFVDACTRALEDVAASEEERTSLRNGLGNLKTKSIKRCCEDLVRRAGADVDLFKRVYKARSELLHDGISKTYPDLPRQCHLLEEIVQKVLLHAVAEAGNKPLQRSYAVQAKRTGTDRGSVGTRGPFRRKRNGKAFAGRA
jgi:hypothetical protein